MAEVLPLLTVIAAGIFFAQFLKPFRVPYVVILMLAGMLIGTHGLDIFQPDETVEFLGEMGLVFLMFMAGLETRFSKVPSRINGTSIIALINGLIPFIVGIGIALFLGYGWITALLLGTIFISSSIAVIVPSLQNNGLLSKKIGKSILGATVAEDALSLIILSFLLNSISPSSSIPLPVYYTLLFALLFILALIIRKIRKMYVQNTSTTEDARFEDQIRFTFVVLLATVLVFELLGLHLILAGFYAGLVLSDREMNRRIKMKLHVLSYGLFIPIFFVLIGINTDISVFARQSGVWEIILLVLAGSMISKFASGFLAGRLSGYSIDESSIIGAATIPQLSTTLAVAFTGFELGILDSAMIVAMTFLSIVTTFTGPFLLGNLKIK